MKKIFTTLVIMVMAAGAWAQAPTNNPFTSRYPEYANRQHWTDSIAWATPIDVTAFGVTPDDNMDDLAALQSLINVRSSIGGGVLYFPAGTYNFSDTLEIASQIVLRGPDPLIPNAVDTNYRPLVKFEFPKYEFDTLANGGAGYPNSSAFKVIEAARNAMNVGLVNIDVNRAGLNFHPHEWRFQPNPKGGGGTYPGGILLNGEKGTMLPDDWPANVLIFGVRNNNAVTPDPSVPNANQRPWQRWAWRFGACIDVNVRRNGIVANCRVNDEPTDDFKQPNYKFSTGSVTCSNIPADGSGATFRTTDHYGISINRGKVSNKAKFIGGSAGNGANSGHGAWGVIVAAEPEDEPMMFATGNLALDNWVFRTMRIAIEAAGTGLEIKGNVVRDIQGKQLWLGVNGTSCQSNASATYENRGIDFSGWGVLIENNVVEANTHRVMSVNNGQYGTVDGEGIMMQECCGGTNGNNYTIRNNIISGNNPQGTNPGISLYKIANMSNILVEDNEFQTRRVLLMQSRTETGSNILVRNNKRVNALTINVNAGGYNVVSENNTAFASNSTADYSCWITVNNDQGFNPSRWRDASNAIVAAPCAPTYELALTLVDPVDTTFYPANTPTIPLLAKARVVGAPAADTVLFYVNGLLVGSSPINMLDTTASFSYAVTDTGYQVYRISARLDDAGGRKAYSTINHAVVDSPKPVQVAAKAVQRALPLRLYPNPAQQELNVALPFAAKQAEVHVLDALGRQVLNAAGSGSRITLPVGELNPGLYLVQVSADGRVFQSRFTRQ